MVMTDPIADMLTRIRNANSVHHDKVEIPGSKIKEAIATILKDEGFIKDFEVIEDNKQNVIKVSLKYGANREKVISGLKRISKPGLRVYSQKDQLPKVLGGLGIARIGKKPITVPAGVTVTVENNLVTVKGPKGELQRQISQTMKITLDNGVLTVERPDDEKENRAMHGLSRTLINNMVEGVTKGFSKSLEIQGVGYRAAKQGNNINFTLGFSHPVVKEPPAGITFDVPAPNKIVISGADKEKVGAVAAEIRNLRPPEPYKGKGIRYEGEHVRRKVGKAGAKAKK